MKAPLALSAILALLLAGCTGGNAQDVSQTSGPGSSVSATGESFPDAASIEARVIDDSGLPLQGVSVAIVELALEAVTDASGSAIFNNLVPGSYKVAAARLGFSSAVKGVEVVANQAAIVTFSLFPIIVEQAYQETFGPLAGYFECRHAVYYAAGSYTASCGTVCVAACVGPPANLWPNDKTVLRFNMSSDNYASFVGDMRWSQTSAGTSTALRVAFSHDNRTSTHWWCSDEGPSPLQFRYQKDGDSTCTNTGGNKDPPEPSTKLGLRMYTNAPFGNINNPVYVTLQQKFELMATIFYGDRAPDEYSAFPDS